MKYRSLKGYKYQVAETFSVRLPIFGDVDVVHPYITLRRGVLTIKEGYRWDGPSGPAIDTKNAMTPSAVHDALYQLIRCGLLSPDRKGDADWAINQLSRERGMSAIRRLTWLNGLTLFGFNAAKLRKVEPQDVILEAP